MSRRSKPAKRIPLADPVYNSVDISKFINRIMRRGKKSLAEKIFYATLSKIEERTNEKALEIFQKAMTNATPLLEVKARRIGGSTYQVPIEVKADRGFALASSWLIEAAKKRGGKSFIDKLTNEIIDASNGVGSKNVKIPTKWLKLTKLLLTTDTNFISYKKDDLVYFSQGRFFVYKCKQSSYNKQFLSKKILYINTGKMVKGYLCKVYI